MLSECLQLKLIVYDRCPKAAICVTGVTGRKSTQTRVDWATVVWSGRPAVAWKTAWILGYRSSRKNRSTCDALRVESNWNEMGMR